MEQGKISPFIIAAFVVVAVVACVGVYFWDTGDGGEGGGGGSIGSATNISFKMDSTYEGTPVSFTLQGKDISGPDVKFRVEGTAGGQTFKYIMNAAEGKAWQYQGGAWTDVSSQLSSLLSDYQSALQGLQGLSQSGWSGGDITATDETGSTIRFYDIQVNPDLPDELFLPDNGDGGNGDGGSSSIIGSATSISFKMDTTSEGTPVGITVQGKDLYGDNVKFRIDGSYGGQAFNYILDAAENKAWEYQGGTWTDVSSQLSSLLSDYQSALQGLAQSEWSGGDVILTDESGTTRFYDIQVNPSLSDELFLPI